MIEQCYCDTINVSVVINAVGSSNGHAWIPIETPTKVGQVIGQPIRRFSANLEKLSRDSHWLQTTEHTTLGSNLWPQHTV